MYSGFTPIVEALAEPVKDKIQMESKVTSIDYSNENVQVTYEDRSGDETTQQVLNAKKVIVTVPLGVLKKSEHEGGIKFLPQLPRKKRDVSKTSFAGIF